MLQVQTPSKDPLPWIKRIMRKKRMKTKLMGSSGIYGLTALFITPSRVSFSGLRTSQSTQSSVKAEDSTEDIWSRRIPKAQPALRNRKRSATSLRRLVRL